MCDVSGGLHKHSGPLPLHCIALCLPPAGKGSASTVHRPGLNPQTCLTVHVLIIYIDPPINPKVSQQPRPISVPTSYVCLVPGLLFASVRQDHCPGPAHRMPIRVPIWPTPRLLLRCTWGSLRFQSLGSQHRMSEGTYSECAAATSTASAARRPRSLVYPSSSPMSQIRFTVRIASRPSIDPWPHVPRRLYRSLIVCNLISDALDSSSGDAQYVQVQWKP